LSASWPSWPLSASQPFLSLTVEIVTHGVVVDVLQRSVAQAVSVFVPTGLLGNSGLAIHSHHAVGPIHAVGAIHANGAIRSVGPLTSRKT